MPLKRSFLKKRGFSDAARKARRARAARGRRLWIMFADDARFGRINCASACRAPMGKAESWSQRIGEFT
jgi:hypothetical protein